MHTSSPLQILPLHIVELILGGYVAGNSRLKSDGISESPREQAVLLMPLLVACPSFTLSAYARIFRVYEMHLTNTSDNDRYKTPFFQTSFTDAGVPIHIYARELVISAGVRDICNGAVLKELSCEPHIDCTFPKVRSIKFTFSLPAENLIVSHDTKANISGFMRRVKEMMPTVKKINISVGRHAVDIGYDIGRQHVIFDQQLNGLRSLSYSSFNSAHIGEQIFQLAQRNSSILQSLKVSGNAITDVSGLLQNTDGSYVQYPCLHTFQLRGPMDFGESQRPEFPGAVPFPSLRRLDIGYVYPFGDDTVFRGNAATLESLILKPSPGTVRILKEYRSAIQDCNMSECY
ncbi:hypothetical protein GGI19_001291 [Coemansia pectinata]|uniref:Uncharacterized protein n=1 Tax=Coemansia pectinata TaxID=1052879 RepID=A0A9W8H3T5_9FUNG|nr:hypothetical protein GGI19_001291 [Coemansia pectinata]